MEFLQFHNLQYHTMKFAQAYKAYSVFIISQK